MADRTIGELPSAASIENEDLFLLEQGGVAKNLSGKLLSDYVYAAAAEKIAEVEQAVEDMQSSVDEIEAAAQAAVDSIEEQKDTMIASIASVAGQGTDTTLTQSGVAADAQATGNAVNDLKSALFDETTYSDWESGGLNPNGGGNITNTARIRLTKFVGINTNVASVRSLTGYEFSVFAWNNSTGSYVGTYTSAGTFVNNGTAKWLNSFNFAAYPSYKFKIVLRNATTITAEMSVSDGSNAIFNVCRYDTDETLTQAYKAADAKKAGDLIGELKNNLLKFNSIDLVADGPRLNTTSNGVTFVWNADKTVCTCNGTASAYAFTVIAGSSTSMPYGIKAGGTYYVHLTTTSTNIRIGFYWYIDGVYQGSIQRTNNSTITIPNTATGVVFYVGVPSGATVTNDTITDIAVLNAESNQFLFDNSILPYTPTGATFSVFSDMPNGTYWKGLKSYFEGGISDPDVVLASGYTYYLFKLNDVVYIASPARGQFYIGTIRTSDSVQTWMKVPETGTAFISRGSMTTGDDFDDYVSPGYYYFSYGQSFDNAPFSTYGGVLIVFPASNNQKLQVCIKNATPPSVYIRISNLGSFPSTWTEIKGGNTYNNTYTSEHYENTYNITCSPTITTDTNNYLASTGDTTDRTGDIQTILNTTGICRLGPGVFYVTGIEIPNYGAIIGSGRRTNIILDSSVTTGYAVKLRTCSTIRDVYIRGATANLSMSDLTPTADGIGTRHGILFEGTADAQSDPVYFYRAAIEGCFIADFTGGGITCNNTGLSPAADLVVSNCQIARCGAGVNIPYFSEFHRFTNISATECYYGCIDNGGNDNFANCDFSKNKIGLLMDNSTGQSRNNAHGVFSCCSFHHSDNTYSGGSIMSVGTAIKILGIDLGEIFNGCMIGYGGIEIDGATGIKFAACHFGWMTDISVTDSVAIVFSDCTFRSSDSSTLTQSDNTMLAFKDCYTMQGTDFDPMAS